MPPPPVVAPPPPAYQDPPVVAMPSPRSEPVPAPAVPPAAVRTPCEVARTLRTPPGERRGQAVADCVEGWLRGEVQEFREGVKREAGEFQAGFDRLRRGLRGLGSRLRGSD